MLLLVLKFWPQKINSLSPSLDKTPIFDLKTKASAKVEPVFTFKYQMPFSPSGREIFVSRPDPVFIGRFTVVINCSFETSGLFLVCFPSLSCVR
ncbi:MAG: hypothetical protein ACD_38C00130G0001 [uncultured bacterium]|nr:MAG: hypothetical protein ACD_38C00130G0001 [uncultured bacterium]